MTKDELIQLAIWGKQKSSLEYMKRFSMCDCLTVKMEDTYTAIGAGLECFLNKFIPGEKWIAPWANKLDEKQLKMMRPVGYKIPKKIDTFLWSPFHEATSTYWDLNDNIKHSLRLRGGFLEKFGVATRVQPPSLNNLLIQVKEMDSKVNEFWGPNVKKIMLYYDNSRALDKQILNKFRKEVEKILDWPIVKVTLTEFDAQNKETEDKDNGIIWNGWEHYSIQTYKNFYTKIQQVEEKYK